MASTTQLECFLEIKGKKASDTRRLPLIIGKSAHESLDHYSANEPSLATATIGDPVREDNNLIYPVEQTLGTKG